MKKMLTFVFMSFLTISTFAKTDMEAEAREMARDRQEARAAAGITNASAAEQARYIRDTLNRLSASDPTLEKSMSRLTSDQRKKLLEASMALYTGVAGVK